MPQCAVHPGSEAVGACARCGRFYCAAEQIDLDLRTYCGECGVRDDVDWLGNRYRKLEGKRSGLAWFLVLLGLPVAATSVAALLNAETGGERGLFGGLLLMSVGAMTVMSGQTWSRLVLLGTVLLASASFVAGTGQPWAAALAVPGLWLSVATWTDVPTQLFFRLPVERAALRRHFVRGGSNPLAVRASRLALLSLFIPGLGVLTLAMGVMALTRINSKAVPPVGNLSVALGAIFFSLFTSLIWLSAFFRLST